MSEEGMDLRVLRLTVQNYMGIETADITPPATGVVVVSGDNGAGKSSLFGSMCSAVMGKKVQPPDPIRTGAKEATVDIDLGSMLAKWRAWRTKSGGLDYDFVLVDKATGPVKRPQEVWDKFLTLTSFDVLDGMHLPPEKQVALLKDLTGLTEQFEQWDAERKRLYDERTVANREVDRAKAQLAGVPDPGEIEAVSISELAAEHQRASGLKAANEAKRQKHANAVESTKVLRYQLEQLQKQLEAAESLEQKVAIEVSGLTEPDVDGIADQLAAAEETNKRAVQHAKHVELAKALSHATQCSESLTIGIGQIDQQKAEALVAADMPVVGLSLGETGLLWNGRPLEQLSQSERIRVWTAIAIAQNPQFGVAFLRSGNDLDDNAFRDVVDVCHAHGVQVWVESIQARDGADYSVRLQEGRVVEQGEGKGATS